MRVTAVIPLAAQVQGPAFDSMVETLAATDAYVRSRGGELFRRTGFRGQTAMARSCLGWEAVEFDKADWLFWIDDDMIVPTDAFERLMAHHDADTSKRIISAAYFSRTHSKPTGEGQYPICAFTMVNPETGKPFAPPPLEPRGIKEVQIVGFGCLLMHRSVWNDVLKLSNGTPFATQVNLTEDVYFLSFARKAGYRVWLDTSLVCGHLKLVVITDKNRERIGGEPQE